MDLIIDWQPFEAPFQGEKVTMELRPLKAKRMLLLTPYMGLDKETDMVKLTVSSLELQELAKKVFPDHMRNLEGITVNGAAVSLEHLTEEPVFLPLTMDIIGELSKRSIIRGDEEKNLDRPSASLPLEDPPES